MSVYVLIPLLPFLAFLTLALGGEWLRDQGHKVGIPAIALSFACTLSAFLDVVRDGPLSLPLYTLIQCGSLVVDLGLYIDQLTVLLLLLVTGVSSVVHVYSSRYMIGDPRYNRFFAVMALFTFAMIMLVMSNNLLMMYIFWEVMGICSYLLISHWSERTSSCRAATKAFLVNSVADVGLGFGVILTFATFGTLDIQAILAQANSVRGQTINLLGWVGLDLSVHTVTLIVLFLFMGALGKSAQIPLHVWLPFAMEAPTPVSALIHAATMVNAGPFLLVRMSPLVILSPTAMTVIAIVGLTTALYAAVVSLTQVDIKKILAYSTISQIGFMIMTCGVGAFVVSIFHLLAHGFFKGFLFLSTGNVLQSASHHEPGESPSGHESLPSPSVWPLAVGSLVLACLPPLLIFSGPYERLWTVQNLASAQIAFWVIGLVTVFFAAIYLFRGVHMLFIHGPVYFSGSGAGLTTSRPQLFSLLPLLGVLVGAVIVGGILTTLWAWFVHFLTPAVGRFSPPLSSPSSGLSTWFPIPLAVAVSGWWVAYLNPMKRYAAWRSRSPFVQSLYVHFLNRLYFDELYEVYVVQPTLALAKWLYRVIDLNGINALIVGIAQISVGLASWLWRVVDLRGIDNLVLGVGRKSVGLAGWLWRVVDLRGIDGVVLGMGSKSVGLAGWLWRVIDLRGIDRLVVGIGERSVGFANWLWRVSTFRVHKKHMEASAEPKDSPESAISELEPRTLQHHLLVMIFWLIVAIGMFYWLAL